LPVNQNGRWAPHFSYLAAAIKAGIIGEVASIDFVLQWDHTWTAGHRLRRSITYCCTTSAFTWFDIATVFMGGRLPQRVYASVQRTSFQTLSAALPRKRHCRLRRRAYAH